MTPHCTRPREQLPATFPRTGLTVSHANGQGDTQLGKKHQQWLHYPELLLLVQSHLWQNIFFFTLMVITKQENDSNGLISFCSIVPSSFPNGKTAKTRNKIDLAVAYYYVKLINWRERHTKQTYRKTDVQRAERQPITVMLRGEPIKTTAEQKHYRNVNSGHQRPLWQQVVSQTQLLSKIYC